MMSQQKAVVDSEAFGLYIHIPFCACRCIYCDFYSTTFGRLKDDYVAALGREMAERKSEMGDDAFARTLYIGGGTPSQLTGEQLLRLFWHIDQNFVLSPDAEVTIEANPDDVTPEWIATLRQTPVNRVSMGVQTFDEGLLRLLRRRHSADQACEAVRRLQEAGYGNISLDLIYGLPGQTMELFERDIDRVLSLDIQHLSAYALMYEEGTPLNGMRERGEVSEADEELSLALFQRLVTRLREAGFEHYEISNFALPGMRSRHNSSYWTLLPYLGLGPGAHSFDGREKRRWNLPDVKSYIERFAHGKVGIEVTGSEILNREERYEERLMLRLRTCRGVDLQSLKAEFGDALTSEMLRRAETWVKEGKLQVDGDFLHLTEEGIFISDAIIASLI